MSGFTSKSLAVALGAVALAAGAAAIAAAEARPPAAGPARYTADGRLERPADYRTWVYLSSGLDMAYTAGPQGSMSMFDNIFVDPAAYAGFQKTGTWPDGTVLVMEMRDARQNGSINKRGRFQTTPMGMEVHVKDAGRFKGGWAFFDFDGDGPGQLLPQRAACYSCHEAHGAVDTTFVQFYPTLLPVAVEKKTLSAGYVADEASHPAK